MQVVVFEPASADESLLRGAHACLLDMEKDFVPDEPETPFEERLATWTAPGGSHRKDQIWVAIEDDQVIGYTHVSTWPDHADSGLVRVAVRQGHRRKGVGSELLLVSLGGLESEGRSKLIVDIPIGSPIEGPAERLGLKRVFSERISQLRVADIDWELMDSWIARASERAGDYELLSMRPPFPDEHMEEWCRIADAMNTAPMEDFDLEDTQMTPEKWRSIETNFAARGYDLHSLVAVHRPSRAFAGMTTLIYMRNNPSLALQDDTVVDPDHRNRGLGRLIKAAMAKDFLAEHPDVERIDTGNAGSNRPMLSINEEMGFRPILEISAWQGEIAVARGALS